jgi:hypothetical protein
VTYMSYKIYITNPTDHPTSLAQKIRLAAQYRYTPPDTRLHLPHPSNPPSIPPPPIPLTLHQIPITLRPTTLANGPLSCTHLPLRHRDLARIVPNRIGPPALGLEASHERLAGGPRDGDVYAAVPEALEREDERRYVVEGKGDGVWVHEGVDAVGC